MHGLHRCKLCTERPLLLTATPLAEGVNWLRWERGDNKRNTQYVVQVMNAETDGFVFVATSSKLSFKHIGQRPGFQQTYRVYAVRKEQMSIPSYTATVYGPEPIAAQTVTLKAA